MNNASENWPDKRKICVIVAPPGWFTKHAENLCQKLNAEGHEACLIDDQKKVPIGHIAFYLSCTKITPVEILQRNKFNIVVHASALPKGRGFSPLVWQILEGQNTIPLSMIEMTEQVDAGRILKTDYMYFEGHELENEMRTIMGEKIIEMCLNYSLLPVPEIGREQAGKSSWYDRRGPKDSEIDPHLSIAEQFNKFRVVNNENYPAFFELNGHKYSLKIDRITS